MTISPEEFAAEYEAGRHRMLALIRRSVRNEEDAEDLASATWAKAWEFREQFTGANGAQFITWVHTIAMNFLKDRWRKQSRPGGANHRMNGSIDEMAHALRAKFNDPGRKIDGERAFRKLGAKVQGLVEMRFVYGYTSAEIAKIVNAPVSTVKVQMFRSLRILRNRQSA